jgi:outer membrane biosynthesis protein TonB
VDSALQKVFASNADVKARQCQPDDLKLAEEQARNWSPDNIRENALMACISGGGRAYVIGKDATPPKGVHTPEPTYPPQFRAKRGQGKAVFVVRVDEHGDVSDVVPLLGPNLADLFSACGVLRRWKFKPATIQGTAVPVFINVEIKFRLY